MSLVLRRATTEDAQLLFDWRNHPSTREASHGTKPLEMESHLRWLDRTLSNGGQVLLIAEEDGVPVGTVRADWQMHGDRGIYKLSWTVAPEARGRGIGRQMVSLAVQHFRGQVRAEIKDWNVQSVRIAEHAGLALDHTENGILHFVGSGGE